MKTCPRARTRLHAALVATSFFAAAVSALSGCVVNAPASSNPGNYGPLEYQTDRPGSDYRSFDLPEARPDLCMAACNNELQCVAFTYVNPGVQGPSPRCWLKSAAPDPVPNGCCVSGVVRAPLATAQPPQQPPPPDYGQQPGGGYPPPPEPQAPAAGREVDWDRPGSDYRSFDLPDGRVETCEATCMNEPQCAAYTYVKPGIQAATARCWLKSVVPNPTRNACCISGVVRGAGGGGAPPPPATPPPPQAAGGGLEPNWDRPGSDYRSFDQPGPDPQICMRACWNEPQCRAFTYVRPGVQAPSARCWLKSAVPQPVPNNCCVSGVK